MIVVPLGVSSATPTAHRHMPAMALWREGEVFLFDCGENTQMQMLKVGMKRSKIEYIFISHLDGDHFYGLPGLISTLHIQRRETDLTVVGPVGIKEFIDFNVKFANLDLTFDIHFIEIEEEFEGGIIVDKPDYLVEARPLNHNRFCLGYRFEEKEKPGKVDSVKASEIGIEKDEHFKALKAGEDVTLDDGTVVRSDEIVGHSRSGKVFAYITDTRKNDNAILLARNADIFVHEATFESTLQDKAVETKHSTAAEAAEVAKEANAKLLVITHFSARYTNEFELYKEAKSVFDNTWVANELRAIFTDPKTEGGMFKPVKPKELHKSSRQHGSSDGRKRRISKSYSSGGRSRGYKKYYDNRSGDYNPRRRSGDRYESRRGDDRRYGDSRERREYDDRYRSQDRNQDRDRGFSRDRDRSYNDRDRSFNRPPKDFNRDNDRDRYRERSYDRYRDQDRDRDTIDRDTRDKKVDDDRQPPIKPRNSFDDYDRF